MVPYRLKLMCIKLDRLSSKIYGHNNCSLQENKRDIYIYPMFRFRKNPIFHCDGIRDIPKLYYLPNATRQNESRVDQWLT